MMPHSHSMQHWGLRRSRLIRQWWLVVVITNPHAWAQGSHRLTLCLLQDQVLRSKLKGCLGLFRTALLLLLLCVALTQ